MKEEDRPPLLQGRSIVIRPLAPGELDGLAAAVAGDAEAGARWSTDSEVIRRWFADPRGA